MKYDILTGFREHLENIVDNKNTADRYYFAVDRLFRPLRFNRLEEISPEWLTEQLANVSGKSEFSAVRNGLKYLAGYDGGLQLPPEQFFKETGRSKSNYSKRPVKTLYLDNINRTVNGMENLKLKLAYRLMMVSGLRVFEVAALRKEDIAIEGNVITLHVRNGKGGKEGVVVCMPDVYLAKQLQNHINLSSPGERLFYSTDYMKHEAGRHGFECHDLRRIAAITYRQERVREPGMEPEQANTDTQAFLRHERFSTTKRYLFNRKLKFKKGEDASADEK
jgi:Site-specific recombinase XerD